MHLLILILWNLIPLCITLNYSKFNNEQPSTLSEDMKRFIKTLAQQMPTKNGFALVQVNTVPVDYLDYSVKTLEKYSHGKIFNVLTRIDDVVIASVDASDYSFALMDPNLDEGVMSSEEMFGRFKNTRLRTIFIFTDKPASIAVTLILQIYATIHSLNFILAYNNEGTAEVLTVYPFLGKNAKYNLTDIKYSHPLFWNKERNLYGFRIRALVTKFDKTKVEGQRINGSMVYSGKDVEILRTITDHLNATLEILYINDILNNSKENPWNLAEPMMNRSQRKKELLKQFDISLLLKSEWFRSSDTVFEDVYPHTMNDLRVLIPKKNSRLNIEVMEVYSRNGLYFMVSFTMVIVPIFLWFTRKYFGPNVGYVELILDLYSVSVISRMNWFSNVPLIKIILLGNLLYSFILSTVIQSKYTSQFVKVKYEQSIDKLEELYALNQPMYISQEYANELRKMLKDSKHEHFLDNLVPLNIDKDEIQKLESVNNKKSIIIAEQDIALFVLGSKKYLVDGKGSFHLMKDSLMPSFQSFKITYGNLLLPAINRVMRRLSEAGLINWLAKKMIFKNIIKGILMPDAEKEIEIDEFKAINLSQIIFAFYILLAGLLVSFIVFLGEIIFYICT